MCAVWMLAWGASGLPLLPSNYWWTEGSGGLGGILNQLQNKDIHILSTGKTTTTSGLKKFKDYRELERAPSPPLLPPGIKARLGS